MKWTFRGDRPIYAQLIEQIQLGILSGAFPPGSSIPSVRVLALEAEVNPNTMQKALSELESQGLLNTHRTAGRTVTEDEKMIRRLKENMARDQIDAFLQGMAALGISGEETMELLRDAVGRGATFAATQGAADTADASGASGAAAAKGVN